MPRLFVALDLPDAVRERLARLRAELRGARWIDPTQLHVTLRFLGSVPEQDMGPLRQQLASVRALPSFDLALAGVGVFPPRPGRRSPPRVLWAGLEPHDPVVELKQAVDEALGPDPETADRGFSPHVTLARFKDDPGPALSPYLQGHAGLASDRFPVGAFHLYESRTTPGGAIYAVVQSYPLLPTAGPKGSNSGGIPGQAPPGHPA